MISILRRGLLVLLAAFPLLAVAAQSPHDVIQSTTNELLSDLKANKQQYKANPNAFYESLNRILGPVVDADGISRSIMTVKYSRKATPEQMQRFQENFKRSLLQFYGNALLEYNNEGIVVDPAKADDGKRASVGMKVTGNNGAVYPVQYTLENIAGEWKVRNVIVNGINIGKLFRDQFADAMQRNGNNLDKTIDGWAGEVAKAKQSADSSPEKAVK
ncbi:UNVERIFIED_ORG: phospholipid transport system substrate-binding protein [Pseudomonas parafulva]|jgi:phospholipid transport system substrate-binding protein|uniref:ABC transporter substrate-binding protein n=2 Tax=Gammaproteobacteria TaxID=1236 RepID=A0A2L1WH59_9PSED|nr:MULTISPECIES: ABC transporter substrate-binding protein [Pseudomonas]MDP9556636.1 phospholipid transport system substrate-binding protein [Pseudomonas parafulva]MDP9664450.1 phospholipid transport system substrate-binding protein [Pseudomonas cremoricolorata]HCL54585.1 ABC transporter substrate-binding protein [Pseudomonas sp.]AVF56751.1 toluene tolerance protein [Pseudomonas fulva]MBA1207146.1 ABC transporter substrate-binding protein [Pseudomonas fulva]